MIGNSNENWKGIDKPVVGCVLLLVAAGLMALASTTASHESSEILKNNFSRQIIWFLLGIVLAAAVVLSPVKALRQYAYWIYGIATALLVLVLFIGSGKGVHRWIEFGPVRFQPSEIAKIGTILALARYLSEDGRDLRRPKEIVTAFAIAVIPAVLILREPDLGTAFVLLAVALPVVFWAGLSPFLIFLLVSPLIVIPASFNIYTFALSMILITGVLFFAKRRLIILILVFAANISVGAVTPKLWDGLRDYQKTRILTFLGVQEDPRGTGYQLAQSQVAIGSGGFWGKGWAKGTQTKLRFLPEQHTDFIFSVIGEEFGFLGVSILLGTFYFLFWRSIQIAKEVKNRFLTLVVIGGVTLLAIHVIVNIGMTVGMMPVTGLPLPFLSYGGSAMLSNMAVIGLILNAGSKRFQY